MPSLPSACGLLLGAAGALRLAGLPGGSRLPAPAAAALVTAAGPAAWAAGRSRSLRAHATTAGSLPAAAPQIPPTKWRVLRRRRRRRTTELLKDQAAQGPWPAEEDDLQPEEGFARHDRGEDDGDNGGDALGELSQPRTAGRDEVDDGSKGLYKVRRRDREIAGYVPEDEWVDQKGIWGMLKPRVELSPVELERVVQALARNDAALGIEELCVAMEMLSIKGHGAQCRRILDGIWDGGYEVPDAYTYAVASRALGDSGRPQEAEDLLNEMRENEVPVTLSNYNAAIRAWGISGNSEGTERLLKELLSNSLRPDSATFTAAVPAYIGKSTEAVLKMMQDMLDVGLKLDTEALAGLISAIVQSGRADQAVNVLQMSESMGMVQDVEAYISIIDGCLSSEKYDQALVAYRLLRNQKLEVGLQEHQRWYRSFFDNGELEKAVEAFTCFLAVGGNAGLKLFAEVLGACDERGDGESAVWLLSRMKEMGIKPDAQTYASARSACEQRGLWPEVLSIVREMDAAGLRVESARAVEAYTKSIFLCLEQQKPERAYRMFLDMERRGLRRSRQLVQALIQACEQAKQWDRAARLRGG